MSWFKKKNRSAEDGPARQREAPGQPPNGTKPGAASEADGSAPTAAMATTPAGATEENDAGAGLMKRLRHGLVKTRHLLTADLDQLFVQKKGVDAAMLETLEEILITADIGVQTALALMQRVSRRSAKIDDAAALKRVLREEVIALMAAPPQRGSAAPSKPHVIMVVGVNGVGKTTTIGKLAARFLADGQRVLIAAADTFRAAAVEQLAIWAQRSGADFVRHKDGADPAAVAYDSIEAARARQSDIVLVDTAGRLHTKTNLMEELKKIKRSIAKILPEAPHEVLLVLDATTGQNALSQARLFDEALGVTGIALTKLDGTAKGGIVVSIHDRLRIPLQYIGVGETTADLQDFDPRHFAEALFA